MFVLPQTPVESPEEEEVRESGYLREAELPQAGPAPLPQPAAVEEEGRRPGLHAVETLRLLSDELLKLLRVPSKNTNAAAAGKSTFWPVFPLVLLFLAYSSYCGAPGTAFSDSLLISNEIL